MTSPLCIYNDGNPASMPGGLCPSCYAQQKAAEESQASVLSQTQEAVRQALGAEYSTEQTLENFQAAFAGTFSETPEIAAIWNVAYSLADEDSGNSAITPERAARAKFESAWERFIRIVEDPSRIEHDLARFVNGEELAAGVKALQGAAGFIRAMFDAAGYEIIREKNERLVVLKDKVYGGIRRDDVTLSGDHADNLTEAARRRAKAIEEALKSGSDPLAAAALNPDPNRAENLRLMSLRDNCYFRNDHFYKNDKRKRPLARERRGEREKRNASRRVVEEAGFWCSSCNTFQKSVQDGMCAACAKNYDLGSQ
jgi:hypothetical protein